jgi:hypothetical protein
VSILSISKTQSELPKPFNIPMRHRFKDEICGPAHNCQEQQDEQRIDDSFFIRTQLKRFSTSTDRTPSKHKNSKRDQP